MNAQQPTWTPQPLTGPLAEPLPVAWSDPWLTADDRRAWR